MARVYTAQEMRDMANAVDDVSINYNGEYYYEKYDKFNPDLVRDMLRQAADMIEREAAEKHSVTNRNRFVNAAKMREALSDACYAMFNFLKTQNGGYEEMAKALDKAKSALADLPRNCDRPECATTKEAQEVWRKEDGGKTAYYEWLLETSTAKGEHK